MDIDPLNVFKGIDYQTGGWVRSRRVIAKMEYNELGPNQRIIVTDLVGEAEQLYSQVYCERGTVENRHKELQMGLFADRMSCTAWWSNQLMVMFSSLAYVLWQTVREKGLVGTSIAKARVWILHQRLIHIIAVVIRNTRRIVKKLSSAASEAENFLIALQRLEGA